MLVHLWMLFEIAVLTLFFAEDLCFYAWQVLRFNLPRLPLLTCRAYRTQK